MMPLLLVLWSVAGAPPGELAYVAETPAGAARVHVVTLGDRSVRVIGPRADAGAPRWSPTGDRIAFSAKTVDGWGIYVADGETGDGGFLELGHRVNRWPVWSPEGDRLAYAVGDGLDSQVAVYDFETEQETLWGGERTSLLRPVWSPPGLTRLLLDPEQSLQLFDAALLPTGAPPSVLVCVGLMGTPGSLTTDLFMLTESEAIPMRQALMPSQGEYEEWLPAASREGLAFESNDGGDREIFVLTRSGTWDVSNHRAPDWHPVWSPDGKWLAFESMRNGVRGVYRTHRDTARVYGVAVDAAGACWGPAWSRDGEWIAYVSDRDGIAGVYVVEVRGEERSRVTEEGVAAYAPAWRPWR